MKYTYIIYDMHTRGNKYIICWFVTTVEVARDSENVEFRSKFIAIRNWLRATDACSNDRLNQQRVWMGVVWLLWGTHGIILCGIL